MEGDAAANHNLAHAVWRVNSQAICAAILAGADPRGAMLPGQSYLLWLTSLPRCSGACDDVYQAVVLLLTGGAPVNDVDGTAGTMNYTPLHYAASRGNARLVRLLLSHGADVDANTADGTTSLHYAAASGDSETVNALLEWNGVGVHRVNRAGQTALHYAAYNGHAAVVEALVANGADAAARDHTGKTALDYALAYEHHSCIPAMQPDVSFDDLLQSPCRSDTGDDEEGDFEDVL